MGSPVTAPEAGRASTDREPAVAAPPAGRRELTDWALAAIAAVATLPILWMGYGTDIDVADVLWAADSIGRGDYHPSRSPGVPVFEAIAAVLDPIGGHLLLNAATAVAGAFTVVGVARLVRAWGHDNGDLVALAFLASPLTIIAATSVGDFMWAVAFLVWGALLLLRERPVLAGVLLGLAVGSRLSTGLLVVALLVAVGWDRAERRRCALAGVVAVPLGMLLYLPSWLAYDRSWAMVRTAQGYRSLPNNLGRFLYKNYSSAGVLLIAVVLVALPALLVALRRWGSDPLLRFGVLGFAVSEGLYFLMPWKAVHLLPSLLTLLLWLAASRRATRPFLLVVIGALVVNGLVAFRPLAPDEPGAATAGRWDPALTVGLLANDIRCRLDAMDEPLQPLNGDAWPCSLVPMRGPTADGAEDGVGG